MGYVKKGFALVFRLLIAFMILLIFVGVYQSFNNPHEPVSFFGYQPLTVLSNSMNPTFETGDMLFVKKVNPTEIKINDVITFREPGGKLITHRVMEVVNNGGEVGFLTKGDNNDVNDGEVVKGQSLLGKEVFNIPNVGYIAEFLRSRLGLVLLIFFPLAGYLYLEIYERKKNSNQKRKEQYE